MCFKYDLVANAKGGLAWYHLLNIPKVFLSSHGSIDSMLEITTRNSVVCNQSLCNWHATGFVCNYLGHVCYYKFGIV